MVFALFLQNVYLAIERLSRRNFKLPIGPVLNETHLIILKISPLHFFVLRASEISTAMQRIKHSVSPLNAQQFGLMFLVIQEEIAVIVPPKRQA